MNWVDLAVVAVVVLSGLLGLWRGLVREALGLAAWVGAVWVAVTQFQHMQPVVRRYIQNPDYADPVAFGLVFLLTLLVLSIIARIFGAMTRRSVLSSLDRTLGLVFGLVRGAALLVAAYILAGMAVSVAQWPVPVLQARTLPLVYQGAEWTADRIPEEYSRPHVDAPPAAPAPASDALLQATPFGHPTGADPHVLHPQGQ